jgi:hypothetical protein
MRIQEIKDLLDRMSGESYDISEYIYLFKLSRKILKRILQEGTQKELGDYTGEETK